MFAIMHAHRSVPCSLFETNPVYRGEPSRGNGKKVLWTLMHVSITLISPNKEIHNSPFSVSNVYRTFTFENHS